jgi:hypothetical protein
MVDVCKYLNIRPNYKLVVNMAVDFCNKFNVYKIPVHKMHMYCRLH